MKISFDEIEETVIENFYGGEGTIVSNLTVVNGNKIMRGHLDPGCSIGTHTHTDACETIFILTGIGKAVCDGVEESLSAGDCHHCPCGSTHELSNTGDSPLEFYAVVAKQ